MIKEDTQNRRLAALRFRDFRLLWIGQLVSMIGSQMQVTAVNWHIYELLRGQSYTIMLAGYPIDLGAEALGLGALGLVRIVPIIVFALIGGMLADARNRRAVLLWTQAALLLFSALLAAVTFTGNATVLAIYLLTAAASAASAFDNPARQSLVPNIVPPKHLSNAVSLNVLQWQIGTIVGPAVAGVMVARLNIGLVYVVDALSFAAVILALLMMEYRGGAAARETGLGWSALVEGIRYTFGSRIIMSTMLLDFVATFFSSARTMLPIVADRILHVGPEGYGLLNTAQPAGAFAAGAITALRKDVRRQGVVLLTSVAIYGLATALFGASTGFLLSYILLALTGAGDTVSTVVRGTIRQLITPDELRGRMTSVNMVFFMGGPQLGELEAGLVASAFGAPIAIVTGGIATVLFTAWIAWRYPALRNYTSDTYAEEMAAT
jgi:MFS family permease